MDTVKLGDSLGPATSVWQGALPSLRMLSTRNNILTTINRHISDQLVTSKAVTNDNLRYTLESERIYFEFIRNWTRSSPKTNFSFRIRIPKFWSRIHNYNKKFSACSPLCLHFIPQSLSSLNTLDRVAGETHTINIMGVSMQLKEIRLPVSVSKRNCYGSQCLRHRACCLS